MDLQEELKATENRIGFAAVLQRRGRPVQRVVAAFPVQRGGKHVQLPQVEFFQTSAPRPPRSARRRRSSSKSACVIRLCDGCGIGFQSWSGEFDRIGILSHDRCSTRPAYGGNTTALVRACCPDPRSPGRRAAGRGPAAALPSASIGPRDAERPVLLKGRDIFILRNTEPFLRTTRWA